MSKTSVFQVYTLVVLLSFVDSDIRNFSLKNKRIAHLLKQKSNKKVTPTSSEQLPAV